MFEIAERSYAIVSRKQVERLMRQEPPELPELRDTPPPSQLARWWHAITDRFTGKSQKASNREAAGNR